MRPTILVLSVLVLVSPIAAALAGQGGGMSKYLTPEERELYREQQGPAGEKHGMTADQRHTLSQQMRQQWAAMSPGDKQNLKAQLNAQWSALSPAQQQAVEQKVARHLARRQPQAQPQSQGLTMDR